MSILLLRLSMVEYLFTQGYALAFRLNATKHDFDMTVGLHPTCSEVFIDLKIRKYDVKDDDDVDAADC